MALGGHSLDPEALDEPLINLVARWATELPSEPAYTYVDYGINPAGARRTLTWSQTHRRARAMAATLREIMEPGDRAALLIPQGLDYITALLGAMYAKVIAVPLFSPDLPGHADRLVRAYADADAACVITTSAALPHVQRFLDGQSVPRPKEIVIADDLDLSLAAGWQAEEISPDDVAYLQYTSGSTRAPAGVQITHRNFTANALQIFVAYPDRARPRETWALSWLPLFHDMGLLTTFAAVMVHGNHSVFTDPVAFVMHPVRWLRLLSEHEAFTVGPNFAFEYCVDRISAEDRAELDLSGVQVCINGAEPIRPSTLSNFAEAFGPTGLPVGAQTPAFGLAEATVFVSAKTSHDAPRVTAFEREALSDGSAIPCAEDAERASRLVSCGSPVGQFVAVVDHETRVEQPDGQVGEIWVNGPNVAPGYWRNPEKTAETFDATLERAGADLPGRGWLRTGDFGVIHDGELYVTGRIKDLIIVDGRNHYPQDVEATTQEAHPGIRRDHVAAFAIEGEETERLIVVAERGRGAIVTDPEEVARAVRAAVSSGHELRVHDFVLVKSGGVPRTSSGKIARNACRQRYLAGDLPVVGGKSTS